MQALGFRLIVGSKTSPLGAQYGGDTAFPEISGVRTRCGAYSQRDQHLVATLAAPRVQI